MAFTATLNGIQRTILDGENLVQLAMSNVGDITSDLDTFVDDYEQPPCSIYQGTVDGFKTIINVDQTFKKSLIIDNSSEYAEAMAAVEEAAPEGYSAEDIIAIYNLYILLKSNSDAKYFTTFTTNKLSGTGGVAPYQPNMDTKLDATNSDWKSKVHDIGISPSGTLAEGVEFSPEETTKVKDYYEVFEYERNVKFVFQTLLDVVEFSGYLYIYHSKSLRDQSYFDAALINKIFKLKDPTLIRFSKEAIFPIFNGKPDGGKAVVQNIENIGILLIEDDASREQINNYLRCKLYEKFESLGVDQKFNDPSLIRMSFAIPDPKFEVSIEEIGIEKIDDYISRVIDPIVIPGFLASYAKLQAYWESLVTFVGDVHTKIYGFTAELDDMYFNLTLNGYAAEFIKLLDEKIKDINSPVGELFNQNGFKFYKAIGVIEHTFEWNYGGTRDLLRYFFIMPKSSFFTAPGINETMLLLPVEVDLSYWYAMRGLFDCVELQFYYLLVILAPMYPMMVLIGVIISVIRSIIRAISELFGGASIDDGPDAEEWLEMMIDPWAAGYKSAFTILLLSLFEQRYGVCKKLLFDLFYVVRAFIDEILVGYSYNIAWNEKSDLNKSIIYNLNLLKFGYFKKINFPELGNPPEENEVEIKPPDLQYTNEIDVSSIDDGFSINLYQSWEQFAAKMISYIESNFMEAINALLNALFGVPKYLTNLIQDSEFNNFGTFTSIALEDSKDQIQVLKFGSGLHFTRHFDSSGFTKWKRIDYNVIAYESYSITKGSVSFIPLGSDIFPKFDTNIEKLAPNKKSVVFVNNSRKTVTDLPYISSSNFEVETFYDGKIYIQRVIQTSFSSDDNFDVVTFSAKKKYIRSGSLKSAQTIEWNNWISVKNS